MEKGTKFKLECKVGNDNNVMAKLVGSDGYRLLSTLSGGDLLTPELLQGVSDIRPPKKPREKVTLPNGRALYRLRDGERVKKDDYCMGPGSLDIKVTSFPGTVAGRTEDTYLSESDGTEDE